ncbi:Two-component response regulator-like [Actinidia chinensis var. chinensis]|uniref:Two-component response regulator-like n=1 Tax=Actinidia chinensis var. chinensis TaxID=1590841 RepID=A0A2R6RCH9_ACTCC|nr:Two-component response regulator-like [Actinidia chinensis var. chinensis]
MIESIWIMGKAVASSAEGMEEESWSSDVVKGMSPPRMVLRVLLVEADDSTRLIIAALLRKCSYRVTAVPDGLKAWETLKGRPHTIDLILTEVELPSISGYALLTLIMEHDICKNIPVIMMSSQDSISVVLKCMLKGAADFLIKPVRRNELKNLWQHVWRRQTQSTGAVSENTAAEQQKDDVTSDNNTAINHSSDCLDSTPKDKECSEKGSDAQGLSVLKWGSAYSLSNTEHEECMILVEKSVMPKSEIGGKSIEVEPANASCNEPYMSTAFMGNDVCARTVTWDVHLAPGSHRGHDDNKVEAHFHTNDLSDLSNGALDLIGKFDCHPKDNYGNLSANDDTNKFSFTPELELSLRRFHPSYSKSGATDEGHILNHSNASVFSQYSDAKVSQPFFPTLTSNCTELKEGPTTFYNELSNCSTENTVGTQSHGAALSNQENTSTLSTAQSGHSEAAFPGPQIGFIPVPGLKIDSSCAGYGQLFPPLFYTQSSIPSLWSSKDHREHSPFLMSSSLHSGSEIHNSNETAREGTNNLESVKVESHGSSALGLSGIDSLCNGIERELDNGASENICNGYDGNANPANSSVRTSVSGSVNDNRLICYGSKGMDAHCSSQREAALMKFRLKRKERCYEKKVRYQSRKRLAEQRPRVKGQFVRQVQTKTPPET